MSLVAGYIASVNGYTPDDSWIALLAVALSTQRHFTVARSEQSI
jgi:hypothetical protein